MRETRKADLVDCCNGHLGAHERLCLLRAIPPTAPHHRAFWTAFEALVEALAG